MYGTWDDYIVAGKRWVLPAARVNPTWILAVPAHFVKGAML
jgi:hypothetical protein